MSLVAFLSQWCYVSNLQFLSRDIGQQYMYASIRATVLLHTNKYTTNVLSSRNWGLELRIIRSSFTDYSECSIHSDMSFKLLYVAICTLLRTPDRSGAVVIVGGGALCVQIGFCADISWKSRCNIEINF